ncbi:recombinase family protein [Coraliomargarita sinensis]|uniref:recombinase family protein n=1 Tax=Coraliomargarita sinensis TaxID=2174842 RepID=UPI001304FC20|nr:recombinase family protein [Coraliomargarita sinensis]
MRCLAYARVSTEEQTHGDYSSIDNQQRIMRSQVECREGQGWKLVHEVTDPGRSGSSLDRPGMREIIDLIRAEEIDLVIVLRIDRLTRSIKDFYHLWEAMEAHGVELFSCTENIDTSSPLGKAVLNIILTFAEFEREMTAERVREKQIEEVKEGKKHPGMAPYGYENDGNRSLRSNSEEAKVVKKIYDWVLKGDLPACVANKLNEKGHRTRSRNYNRKDGSTRVGGKKWTADKVQRIVRNPVYKGFQVAPGGTEEYKGRWSGLVSPEIWDAAQKCLDSTRPIPLESRSNKHEMLLKGKLFCGHCGQAMSPKPGGKPDKDGNPRNYYVCQNVISYGRGSDCAIRNLPGKAIDDFLVEIIGEFGKHPEIIKETLANTQKEAKRSTRPLKSELARLRKAIKEREGELDASRRILKQSKGKLRKFELEEAERIAESLEGLNREKSVIEAQIKHSEGHLLNEHMVAEALGNFSEVFESLDFQDRSRLMELLIEKVRVTAIDPEKDKIPSKLGVYDLQIRTSCYRIDVDFCIKALFQEIWNKAVKSSYLNENGLP